MYWTLRHAPGEVERNETGMIFVEANCNNGLP